MLRAVAANNGTNVDKHAQPQSLNERLFDKKNVRVASGVRTHPPLSLFFSFSFPSLPILSSTIRSNYKIVVGPWIL